MGASPIPICRKKLVLLMLLFESAELLSRWQNLLISNNVPTPVQDKSLAPLWPSHEAPCIGIETHTAKDTGMAVIRYAAGQTMRRGVRERGNVPAQGRAL